MRIAKVDQIAGAVCPEKVVVQVVVLPICTCVHIVPMSRWNDIHGTSKGMLVLAVFNVLSLCGHQVSTDQVILLPNKRRE